MQDLKLSALGERLRQARLEDGRDESQARFAARIGISVTTYRKMEKGDPSIPIGYWVAALWICGRLDEIDGLFKNRNSLFDLVDGTRKPGRKRASGHRKTP